MHTLRGPTLAEDDRGFFNLGLRSDVVVQADGRVVLGATTNVNGKPAFMLVRYTADGKLDRSFSHDGVATMRLARGAYLNALALEPDGRILAAGAVKTPLSRGIGHFAFGIARFDTDGTTDRTFSGDGRLVIKAAKYDSYANSIIVLPDHSILALGDGSDDDTSYNIAAAGIRLHPNGRLWIDRKKNLDGKILTGIVLGVTDAAIAPSGKYAVSGRWYDGELAAARLRPTGFDPTFSHDGQVHRPLGRRTVHQPGEKPFREGFDGDATSVAVDGAGRIVVGSQAHESDFPDGRDLGLGLTRWLPSGKLDKSFGDHGSLVSIDWDAATASGDVYGGGADDLLVDRHGRIVAAGSAGDGSTYYSVSRYRDDGSLDTSFAGDGVASTAWGWNPIFVGGVALAPNGDIIASGTMMSSFGSNAHRVLGAVRFEGGGP